MKKYTLVFSSAQMNALIADILIQGSYGELPAVFIVDGDEWQMYFPDELFPKLEEVGYANCFTKNFLTNYKKEAAKILQRLDTFIKRNSDVANFDIKEYTKFFNDFMAAITEFFKLYSSTEFFYFGKLEKELLDWAVKNFPKNSQQVVADLLAGKKVNDAPPKMRQIVRFISEVQHIRLKLREKLNESFFGDSLFVALAINFQKLTGRSDFMLLTIEEIRKVLLGGDVPSSEPRKSLLAIYKERGLWQFVTGNQAQAIIRKVKPKIKAVSKLVGRVASPGKAVGVARVYAFGIAHTFSNMNQGDILVASTTGPEFMIAIKRAGAIVTDEGGLMSHAAVISREFKTPCVVGTKIATKVFKDGDLVEVDANNGVVKILKRAS